LERTASRTSRRSGERWADAFQWDFIGNLQSRKVKALLSICRLIHSVATDSVLEQLRRHADPSSEVLIEVNVAEEEGKGGVAPAELGAFIERCPVRVGGLMTMPPFSDDPEASRPHFARLAELASDMPVVAYCRRTVLRAGGAGGYRGVVVAAETELHRQ